MFSPRVSTSFLLALFALFLNVLAQEATITDGAGNVVDVSYVTNARGSTTRTVVLETLSAAPTQAAPAVVATPVSRCTTAGCPVDPTLYTVNGVVMTFVPTTPPTPVPTWTSSGRIIPISSYITTTLSASLLAMVGPAVRNVDPTGPAMMALGIVGGLIGALFVL